MIAHLLLLLPKLKLTFEPTHVHLFVRAVSLLSHVGSPKSVVVMDAR